MAATKVTQEIVIPPLMKGVTKIRIIGITPMFQNRMTAKVKQVLLLGGEEKTRATKKATLKHNPPAEYRDSMERMSNGPTAMGVRVVALKAAMCTAALETPGIAKTSAQRLLFMPGELAPLYGVPQLRMDVTRSAGINRTPDIRTRAFLPKWGAEIEVHHILPQLTITNVITMACNAGQLVGIGDYRQEKGKGGFGLFRVIAPEQQDDEWDDLVANHGREAQLQAIDSPEYADADTEELMSFFFSEFDRRAS